MRASESSFIHFVRSITLLATLLVVPGIAVFWNHLPRDIVYQSEQKTTTPKTDETEFFHVNLREDSGKSATSVTAFVPEPAMPPPTPKIASEVSIPQVVGTHSYPAPSPSPQDFESLAQHLKALGATYYRLEKWGNRGELFRFSCFVTPSEPYAYERHFQAIGADAVMTIRSVIAEIETWKNVPPSR